MTAFLAGLTYENYIQGEWIQSITGAKAPSINPANKHEVVGYLQMSGKDDLNHAVGAARSAQLAWRKLTGAARGDFLYKAAKLSNPCFARSPSRDERRSKFT